MIERKNENMNLLTYIPIPLSQYRRRKPPFKQFSDHHPLKTRFKKTCLDMPPCRYRNWRFFYFDHVMTIGHSPGVPHVWITTLVDWDIQKLDWGLTERAVMERFLLHIWIVNRCDVSIGLQSRQSYNVG